MKIVGFTLGVRRRVLQMTINPREPQINTAFIPTLTGTISLEFGRFGGIESVSFQEDEEDPSPTVAFLPQQC
jgi:hypothetical protein